MSLENKVLKKIIDKKDSVIGLQAKKIEIHLEDLVLQREIIINKDTEIENLREIVSNEVKIGKNKSRKSFFYGIGIGTLITLILSLIK